MVAVRLEREVWSERKQQTTFYITLRLSLNVREIFWLVYLLLKVKGTQEIIGLFQLKS